MKSCAIVGFGKFGELLAGILAEDFKIYVVTSTESKKDIARKAGYEPIDKEQIAKADYIFVTSPISAFENVIKNIAPFVSKNSVVMDACSVKTYPAKVMRQHLKHAQSIVTHPLFGPESVGQGLGGLRMMLSNISANQNNYDFWKVYWTQKGLNAIESTPEEHDQETIYTQGLAFLIAHLLEDINANPKTFLTENYSMLEQVKHNLTADTHQLFIDILAYNPDLPKLKSELDKALLNLQGNIAEAEAKQRTLDF